MADENINLYIFVNILTIFQKITTAISPWVKPHPNL